MRLRAASAIGFILLLLVTVIFVSCQSDAEVEFRRYYSNGGAIYQARCQNCHGAHGEGLQALIPPLNDTTYIKTNKSALACYIKNGMKGKIIISSRHFEGDMPASDLAPVEIADVLTYITNSFGNKSGTATTRQVEEDLKNCR